MWGGSDMEAELTVADKDAYKKIPNDKWVDDVDMCMKFPRSNYRMQRLEDAGMLESRVVGKIPVLTKQYRKMEGVI